ncbi:hypothetical protein [Acinetobacter nectaris]|uniref:hypothetical protein n=1 Tax=Acinetobacter nectaris TaxID=1219382 RepID=UPI001F47F708|nr:hypothetical protein [Acinetobacter nectaris]MCF9000281.1 hypothetical protein [Acinetobacter nectaris]MCF9028539.1 hypothetical protein [Acinetobacter nectaris]
MSIQKQKDEVREDLNKFEDELENKFIEVNELINHYEKQDGQFRQSGNNYDNNEDHPPTFDEDSDNIQGADRAEELSRLEEFQDNEENIKRNYKEISLEIEKDIENAKDIEDIQNVYEHIHEYKRSINEILPEEIDPIDE